MNLGDTPAHHLPFAVKLRRIHWSFLLLLCAVAAIGAAMLYSAGGGSVQPWAVRHCARFAMGLMFLIAVSLTDVRLWLRYAYAFYALALVLLAAVEVAGSVGMGAQRWIDLGVIKLQPSELMKVALVLALARYFQGVGTEEIGRPLKLIVPLVMVGAPAALVLKQPDLGTALMLLASSGVVFFAAGVRLWMFALVAGAGLAAAPFAWRFLHDYQRQRVLTFIDPSTDPLGSGYHILQSKIALGSGGVFGKGFLQGSQSHLNFLPEKQTDFIFTMFAEEMGLVGAVALVVLYALILAYCFTVALSARHQFGRLLVVGITMTFFLYVFINMAMVMGLIPVVGVPLPLISYGGTAAVTIMIGFGLIMSIQVHRDVIIGRHGEQA